VDMNWLAHLFLSFRRKKHRRGDTFDFKGGRLWEWRKPLLMLYDCQRHRLAEDFSNNKVSEEVLSGRSPSKDRRIRGQANRVLP